MRKKIGPILGWVVTIAILVYLFRTIPFAQVAKAIHAAYWWAIPADAILVLAVYLAD